MKNRFKIKDNRTFGQKAKSFGQSLLFWKGRSKGMIHTRNIVWSDLKYIFFPSKLEKYGYLNIIFWNDTNKYYKALYPLVLAMDYEAKPKWCPRWFLRFLHVFGNDKSLVRVRNRKLHNLHTKLTKGILVWDWKTKWTDYDLRISISGPDHLQELASAIEDRFYSTGRQKELVKQIKAIDPNASIIWGNIERLEKKLEELENESNIRV
jgi:hypothetical protein